MLREIVIDTETTGLDAANGDRLIEIGCIEIVNRIPTGREFHRYLNPERDVHPDAVAVHGLTTEFLQGQAAVQGRRRRVPGLHRRCPAGGPQRRLRPGLHQCRAWARWRGRVLAAERVVDTLMLARRRHPAGPNSLDALCKRYGIDNSARAKHGALLDSLLLADVYVELLGERQATLGLDLSLPSDRPVGLGAGKAAQRPGPLPPRINANVEIAHQHFVKSLGPQALWLRFTLGSQAAAADAGA